MEVKLIYGEALEEMTKLYNQKIKVDAIITDPPYGTTACKWDSIIHFDLMWAAIKRIRNDNSPIILFGNEPFSSFLRISNIKEYKYDWIWVKNKKTGFLNAKKQPLRQFENISIFYNKQSLYVPQKSKGHKPVNSYTKHTSDGNTLGATKIGITGGGQTDRYPSNLLYFPVINNDNSSQNKFHPTQKPVALMEYLIKTYTNEGDTILDFTCGSGSTGVACKNLNRNFIGIDNGVCEKEGQFKDWKWIDVAKWRIENGN